MLHNEQRRLIVFTRLLAVSALCCLGFSWKLWLSRPLYPMAPVLGIVPPFAAPWDAILFGSLVALLMGVIIRPCSKMLVALVLATFGLLFLQDQSRLWPSFYQFCFLFLLLSSRRPVDGMRDSERILAGMRFVLAMIYFWGGVHKLNLHFFHEEFPWFIEPVTNLLPFEVNFLSVVAVIAATFEILIGAGLLTSRFRNYALTGAMLMHLLIFFCIGPLRDHWNNSSWIWGQTVALQTLVLFLAAPPFRFQTMFAAPRLHCVPQYLAVALIGVMPALNGVNAWDSALSFNVYSGNVDYAEIHLEADAVDQLPDKIAALVDVQFGEGVLVLNKWSLSEFNANTYPETRIFKHVYRKVCTYLPEGSAWLYVKEKAGWFSPKRLQRYEQSDL